MKEVGVHDAVALKERQPYMLFKMPRLQRSILFVYGIYKDVAAMRLIKILSLWNGYEQKRKCIKKVQTYAKKGIY